MYFRVSGKLGACSKKEKGQPELPSFPKSESLDYLYVLGLPALGALYDVELYCLTLL
jgi:hypothetical protein